MHVNRVHSFRDSEEMGLLTHSEVILAVRRFQNRGRWGCWGETMLIAEQIGQALTKKFSQLHWNGLDTTGDVFLTPSVWSKSLFLFLQPLLTICRWRLVFCM